jgi:hypothetical protein
VPPTRGSPDPDATMPHETFTLRVTARQAEALRSLASAEDLPPEVYAAEVLAKHLYHAYAPPPRTDTADPWKTDPSHS